MNLLNPRYLTGTIANNTATYADKDAFGAKFALADIFSPGLSGLITSLEVFSQVPTEIPNLSLYLFDTDIGTYANNASFAVTDAENLTEVCRIDINLADWVAKNLNASAQAIWQPQMVRAKDSSGLFGQFMIKTGSSLTMAGSSTFAWRLGVVPMFQ